MDRVLACIFLSVLFSWPIHEALGQPSDGGSSDPIPPIGDVIKPVPVRIDHRYAADIPDGPNMSLNYVTDFSIAPSHYAVLYGFPGETPVTFPISLNYDFARVVEGCRFVPASSAKGAVEVIFDKIVTGPLMFPPTPPSLRFRVYRNEPLMGKLKCGDQDPTDFPIISGEVLAGQMPVKNGSKWSVASDGISDVAEMSVACSLSAPGTARNIFKMVEMDAGIEVNHTKTKNEIREIGRQFGYPNSDRLQALTVVDFMQLETIAYADGKPAEFGPGSCFWMTQMLIKIPKPIIFIPVEFPVTSCQYEALTPHEREHFEHFLSVMKHYVGTMNDPTSSISSVPSPDEPSYTNLNLSDDNKNTLARVVGLAWNNRYASGVKSVMAEVATEYDEVDTQATYAKCPDWGP